MKYSLRNLFTNKPDGICWEYNTICSVLFTELRHKWYSEPSQPHSSKRVPLDLKLSWPIISVWSWDDGHNKGRSFKLCTQSFSNEDVDFLVSKIQLDVGIMCQRKIDTGKPIIVVPSKFHGEFLLGISEFLPCPSLEYKCKP